MDMIAKIADELVVKGYIDPSDIEFVSARIDLEMKRRYKHLVTSLVKTVVTEKAVTESPYAEKLREVVSRVSH